MMMIIIKGQNFQLQQSNADVQEVRWKAYTRTTIIFSHTF